jgi:hypothetical protein
MRLFLLQIGEEYPPDLRGEICAHLHREVSKNPWIRRTESMGLAILL